MRIAGRSANIIESIIAFESCIKWTGMNSRMEAEDAGMERDHLKAKLALWESMEKISELRAALPPVSETVSIKASPHEYPFGAAYNCEQGCECVILGIGDIATEQMNVGTMEIELAVSDIAALPWEHDSLPFNLSNFAVAGASRRTEESKTAMQKGEGWAAFRHGWSRPEISLSLIASGSAMGGTLRWLAEIARTAPFEIACNSSMMLADGRKEIAVVCAAWGNLKRIGNSGLWECEFSMTEIENAG